MAANRPTLFVCMTCRAGQTLVGGEVPQGALLHDALCRQLHGDNPVLLRETTCMANCERGCSAAIAMPGKWTNLLGHLSPALAGDLLAYAVAYAASPAGTVMPSRRPASLSRMVVGRVPDLTDPGLANPELADPGLAGLDMAGAA